MKSLYMRFLSDCYLRIGWGASGEERRVCGNNHENMKLYHICTISASEKINLNFVVGGESVFRDSFR